LLALLLPPRFEGGEVRDFQSYAIERLREENARLRAERDGLKSVQAQAARLGDGIRKLVLDLIDARSFAESISVATSAAPLFGADRATLCVESDGAAPKGCEGVRLIAPGTAAAVLGRDSSGLSGGSEALFGPGGSNCASVAVFRLRIGRDSPAAIYVLGAREPGRFEGDDVEADLAFFAHALERSIRAWLDLPKL
jgi:hypothetical protein